MNQQTEDTIVLDEDDYGVDPALLAEWSEWETRSANDFIYQYERGRLGKNIGLASGSDALDKYTYGTHVGRYYLIGADSSVGKSTFGDFVFVFNAWRNAKRLGRPIKIFYCSFEMGKADKLARWISYVLFIRHKIQLPGDYILSRIEGNTVDGKYHKKIMAAYAEVRAMMADMYFQEDVIHPTAIFEGMIDNHFEKIGKVERTPITEEERARGRKGYVRSFTPHDPDYITMLYLDHLALVGSEAKLDTKQLMDRMSRYGIILRNLFHSIIVYIQQFSTDLMSFHRSNKKNPQSIAPQRIDFGDSKATYRDADVVFGLVNPLIYDFDKFMGYQLSGFGDEQLNQCFRAVYLMKNRYGPSGRVLPMFMDGITGTLMDLPVTPANPLAMQPWYDRASKIEELCQIYSPSQTSL